MPQAKFKAKLPCPTSILPSRAAPALGVDSCPARSRGTILELVMGDSRRLWKLQVVALHSPMVSFGAGTHPGTTEMHTLYTTIMNYAPDPRKGLFRGIFAFQIAEGKCKSLVVAAKCRPALARRAGASTARLRDAATSFGMIHMAPLWARSPTFMEMWPRYHVPWGRDADAAFRLLVSFQIRDCPPTLPQRAWGCGHKCANWAVCQRMPALPLRLGGY